MATEAQVRVWSGPSRRRVPRFPAQAPLDVTVLRSGIPDTVPGRSVNLCERGIAAMLAGELVPGEAVGVDVQLPSLAKPLRTRAVVRYQDRLLCGLEFVGLSPDQRTAIRDWAKEAKAEAEVSPHAASPISELASVDSAEHATSGAGPSRRPAKRKKRFGIGLAFFLILVVIAAALFWWRWDRGWKELESGLKTPAMASAERPRAHVPTEVMQKLLVHKVEPTYPPEARKANLQGIIALDIVVGRDGSVAAMHALNGPEILARAAMDALRWWKFDPYRINGEPAVVETTVAVEFKK